MWFLRFFEFILITFFFRLDKCWRDENPRKTDVASRVIIYRKEVQREGEDLNGWQSLKENRTHEESRRFHFSFR
jgi:hypothetical protein